MHKRDELLRQAQEARGLAAKAQRLAMGLGDTNPDDVARLVAYAEELDEKARTLEGQAFESDLSLPPVPLVVPHSQQQAQQQQSETASAADSAALDKGPIDEVP